MRKNWYLILMFIIFLLIVGGCNFGTGDPAETDDDIDTIIPDSDLEIYKGKGDDFFIAIHCEPGNLPLSTEYVAQNWPALTQLVRSADTHELKLTLLFNPQWAMYILQNPERKELLRWWERNGHEIGIHHHGPSMDNWNGYTNQLKYASSMKYIGTIDEMLVLINMLPVSGQVNTGCINSADQEFDFPQGIIYETNGGANKIDDLWSVPIKFTWSGQDTLRLTHARYAAKGSNVNIDLNEMTQLLDQNQNNEVTGIVFHVFEYAENPVPFDSLFQLLQERGIHTSTVSTIMEAH